MSLSAVVLGPRAKIKINEVSYGVVSGRYRAEGDKADTTDTTAYPYKYNKVGLQEFQADIDAQVATDVNPHNIGVLNINVGTLVKFELDIDGGGTAVYTVPELRITRWEGGAQVSGSQPQTFSFSGASNGSFTMRSD